VILTAAGVLANHNGSNLPPFFGGMAGYIKGMYTELGAK
jgi:hypothetical protein